MSQKKNGWEIALDILGVMAVGAIAVEKAKREQKIQALIRKPEATDEDVTALIDGLNDMWSDGDRARALSAWSRSRSITVAQMNHICDKVSTWNEGSLVDAVLSEEGISDPQNAMHYSGGSYWDRGQTIQKILRQRA